MTHADDHCDELLAAYVLGACPDAEAADIAEHLARCPRCATAVEVLREGADMLLTRTAPRRPPPRIKDRVMAPVRAEAALFNAAREGASEPNRTHHTPPARAERTRPPAQALATAILCVLLLIAAGTGLSSSRLGSGAPARKVVVAQIQENQPRSASASLQTQGARATLHVSGLRHPGHGRIYQIWVRRNREAPEPAGAVLRVDARGAATARLPKDIRRFDQVLVTSEPAGGSPLPTRVPALEVATSA